MPVIIAGNKEQQKKYLGRLVEEPLLAVSLHNLHFLNIFALPSNSIFFSRRIVSLNQEQGLMSAELKLKLKRKEMNGLSMVKKCG